MDDHQADPARLIGGYPGRMLALLTLSWAATQTGRFLLPPLLPAIIGDLAITPFKAGVALSVMSGVFAVFQYPTGRLSDAIGRRTLVVSGLVLLGVGFALIGGAPTYAVFVLGAATIGVAKSGFAVPSRAYVSDLFVDRRGRAMGVYTAGSDLGGLSASAVAVAVLAVATWRAPFLPIAFVIAAAALAVHRHGREPYVLERASLEILPTVRRLLATPFLRSVVAGYALFFFAIDGVTNFLPLYLQTEKGFSPALASGGFALLFVVGLVTKPLAGSLSDRRGRAATAAAAMGLGAASLGVLIVAGSLPVVVLAIAAMAVGYKAVFPVADALVLDLSPADSRGGDLGAARAVATGVGSLGPAVVGYVAQHWNYTLAFAGLALGFLSASAVLLRLSRRR